MTDLYTFDYSSSLALKTYEAVRVAFSRIFSELKIPFLVAHADSGNMGGDLSHEYHFVTSKGEDLVFSCTSCDYVANEEVARRRGVTKSELKAAGELNSSIKIWRGISKDRTTLINVWYPQPERQTVEHGLVQNDINIHALRKAVPELDTSITDIAQYIQNMQHGKGVEQWKPTMVANIFDCRVPDEDQHACLTSKSSHKIWPMELFNSDRILKAPTTSSAPITLDVMKIKDQDACPNCSDGRLRANKAIELGHTFHLGTRYSESMQATIKVPVQHLDDSQLPNTPEREGQPKLLEMPMQMGCHGIGVTRMIGTVAQVLADETGLNWPRVIAPFEVIILAGKNLEPDALEIYDTLDREAHQRNQQLDLVLDDRANTPLGWKLNDADLVGYPVIVVLGKGWQESRRCEVQCRRLQVKQQVAVGDLSDTIHRLLERL